MTIDSIIFDLDGTLWDSTNVVAEAWNTIIHQHTVFDLVLTGDYLKNLFGKTMDVIAENLFPSESKERQLELIHICGDYENEYIKTHCGDLYPDLEKVLSDLSKRYPLFIVSNCQEGYIESFLEVTGFQSYFKDHLCPGDTGKAKASNIKEIIRRHQLKNPVYVGDTIGDYQATKDADPAIPFVFASYGFGTVEHPDYTITSLPELLKLF